MNKFVFEWYLSSKQLQWLQLLCIMNISIPLEILFDMFNDGMVTLHGGPAIAPTEDLEELDENKEDDKPKLIVEVRSGIVNPDLLINLARPLTLHSTGALLESAEDQPYDNQCQTKEEIYLTCFNLTIDVLNGQLELQDVELQNGLNGQYAPEILTLVNKVIEKEKENSV